MPKMKTRESTSPGPGAHAGLGDSAVKPAPYKKFYPEMEHQHVPLLSTFSAYGTAYDLTAHRSNCASDQIIGILTNTPFSRTVSCYTKDDLDALDPRLFPVWQDLLVGAEKQAGRKVVSLDSLCDVYEFLNTELVSIPNQYIFQKTDQSDQYSDYTTLPAPVGTGEFQHVRGIVWICADPDNRFKHSANLQVSYYETKTTKTGQVYPVRNLVENIAVDTQWLDRQFPGWRDKYKSGTMLGLDGINLVNFALGDGAQAKGPLGTLTEPFQEDFRTRMYNTTHMLENGGMCYGP